MSASKRNKTLRAAEPKRLIDDDGSFMLYDRKPAISKRLEKTAATLRKSRIRNGGPLKSPGIPAEILAEQSRKKSPRQIRNEASKLAILNAKKLVRPAVH